MKFTKLFFGLLVTSLFFTACNKDDSIDDIDNKLQNRWAVTDALLYGRAPINDTIIYYTGTSADYFDFRSNGKVYSNWNGQVDTSDYQVIAGNKIVSEGDTVSIRVLTNSQLQLFTSNTSNGVIQELTINLKK